jgi:hypothetical protein
MKMDFFMLLTAGRTPLVAVHRFTVYDLLLPHWLVHNFTMLLNNNEHCFQCHVQLYVNSKYLFNVEKFPRSGFQLFH